MNICVKGKLHQLSRILNRAKIPSTGGDSADTAVSWLSLQIEEMGMVDSTNVSLLAKDIVG